MNEVKIGLKRSDFDDPPTVVGRIKAAWSTGDSEADVLHVEILDSDDDLGNLLQVIGDESNSDPKRPPRVVPKTDNKVPFPIYLVPNSNISGTF